MPFLKVTGKIFSLRGKGTLGPESTLALVEQLPAQVLSLLFSMGVAKSLSAATIM